MQASQYNAGVPQVQVQSPFAQQTTPHTGFSRCEEASHITQVFISLPYVFDFL
jgi:hypothetical protein